MRKLRLAHRSILGLAASGVVAAGLAGCGGGGLASSPDLGMPVNDLAGDATGGGDDAAIDAGSDGATREQACTAAATAYCNAISRCAPVFFQIAYPDLNRCVSRLDAACRSQMALRGSTSTPDQQIACANALAGVSCDDLVAGMPPASCIPPPGTLMNGAGCGDDAQCMSGYCARPNGMACGACGPPSADGSSCAQVGCSRGFRCSAQTQVCRLQAKAGAACDADHPCVDTTTCVNQSCQARLPLGAMCDPKHTTTPECDGLHGIYCHGFSNKCEMVELAGAGGSCGAIFMNTDGGISAHYVACSGAGYCRIGDGGSAGTCIAPAADGTACDGQSGPGCLPPAGCAGGVCKLFDPSTCN